MRLTKKQTKRAVSLTLCLALLMSMLAFALTVRAEDAKDLADTGAALSYDGSESNLTQSKGLADTGASLGYVYCKNTAGWSTVNAYMWIKDTTTANANWPGQVMTKVSGNIWRFEVTNSSWNMIIFNDGSKQTTDLEYPGAGYIYDNTTKQWSVYETQPTTVTPTTVKPTTVSPTTPKPTQGGSTTGKSYVYCENEAGWSTVYAYMWNSDSDKNHDWPGVKMTNIGGSIWRYEFTKNYANIIFNVGSDQTKTGDMSFPGAGYIYNNKTGTWDIYDTSPLQVSSFATDLASPQYNGVGITLSAEAEGEGTVYYKFSVTKGSSTTVLSDFSTSDKAVWTPKTVGTYTLTYDFKDAKGNTNKRTKEYVIEDGSSVVTPFFKTVTPNSGDIKNNANVQINVSAGGGKTGTNLLFYKYTIQNPSGTVVNVPYYTQKTTYTFKPTVLGLYTLTINVQGSDNKTVERSYIFNSVGTVSPTTPPETQPSVQPTQAPPAPTQAPPAPTQAPKPTQAPSPTVLYGDADSDGKVTIFDATAIQRQLVDLDVDKFNEKNADVDLDGKVTIFDATVIQRFLVDLYETLPVKN